MVGSYSPLDFSRIRLATAGMIVKIWPSEDIDLKSRCEDVHQCEYKIDRRSRYKTS